MLDAELPSSGEVFVTTELGLLAKDGGAGISFRHWDQSGLASSDLARALISAWSTQLRYCDESQSTTLLK